MKIELLEVSVEQSGKGWSKANIKFRDIEKNRSGTKTLVSFGDGAEVYKTLTTALTGSNFEITLKKNGEYWDWVKAVQIEQGINPAQFAGKSATPNRGFETPEERAQRQVYIVRQSSLANALSYLELTKQNKAAVADVTFIASQFEDYVFGKKITTGAQPAVNNPFHDMKDDIPL